MDKEILILKQLPNKENNVIVGADDSYIAIYGIIKEVVNDSLEYNDVKYLTINDFEIKKAVQEFINKESQIEIIGGTKSLITKKYQCFKLVDDNREDYICMVLPL